MRRHLLILGGTGEALALARALAVQQPDLVVTTSLAGVTAEPVRPPGRLRVGGFGGADGLARWLCDEQVGMLVDATHPFAATMASHAAQAAKAVGVARLKLVRPMWQRQDGDRWIMVDDAAAASAALEQLQACRVFLTLGARDLAAFAGLGDVLFTVRQIEPPAQPLPLVRIELILARGPYDLADELELLRSHAIDVLVAKASGGEATRAKIDAARSLGLPVVMIARPTMPPGEAAGDVSGALDWIARRLAG